MAYSPKGVMDIYEILSRWHAGYSISGIAEALGIDRKTVRRYVKTAEGEGFSKEAPLPERSVLLEQFLPLVADKERQAPARSQFEPYRDEIVELVTRTTDPLKPKTAFEVICYRHDIEASYTSFKRFMRKLAPELTGRRTTCRIEVDPGDEIQVDYAKMGRLYDPEAGRLRREAFRERRLFRIVRCFSIDCFRSSRTGSGRCPPAVSSSRSGPRSSSSSRARPTSQAEDGL